MLQFRQHEKSTFLQVEFAAGNRFEKNHELKSIGIGGANLDIRCDLSTEGSGQAMRAIDGADHCNYFSSGNVEGKAAKGLNATT